MAACQAGRPFIHHTHSPITTASALSLSILSLQRASIIFPWRVASIVSPHARARTHALYASGGETITMYRCRVPAPPPREMCVYVCGRTPALITYNGEGERAAAASAKDYTGRGIKRISVPPNQRQAPDSISLSRIVPITRAKARARGRKFSICNTAVCALDEGYTLGAMWLYGCESRRGWLAFRSRSPSRVRACV